MFPLPSRWLARAEEVVVVHGKRKSWRAVAVLAGSRFLGWDFEVSCRNAPTVTIQASVAHICRPVFRLR